jgi:hypothetical protein
MHPKQKTALDALGQPLVEEPVSSPGFNAFSTLRQRLQQEPGLVLREPGGISTYWKRSQPSIWPSAPTLSQADAALNQTAIERHGTEAASQAPTCENVEQCLAGRGKPVSMNIHLKRVGAAERKRA